MAGKWDVGMATPEHTPRGRGYDSSLSFFYHCNDYYNFTVDDDFGAGPHSCREMNNNPHGKSPSDLSMDESIVDLWVSVTGGAEGPAWGINNSLAQCNAGNAAFTRSDPDSADECRYEDAIFRDHTVAAIKEHDFTNQPLFIFYVSTCTAAPVLCI